MSTDNISPVILETVKDILHVLEQDKVKGWGINHEKAVRILTQWDGNHQTDSVGPTIYYKLLSCIMEQTFSDELGDDGYRNFVSSHLMKRTTAHLIRTRDSVWWDNVKTSETKESRKIIFSQAFKMAIQELEKQLGENVAEWHWGKVHTLEHGHLLGRQKPLDKIFNIGPFPISGGNEVINNTGFSLNRTGRYNVTFGPSMRILIDFADIENSISINPTGQSGYFMSRHYKDQAKLFNQSKFRLQMMNRQAIEASRLGRLMLLPE